jgi:hypothetical protein
MKKLGIGLAVLVTLLVVSLVVIRSNESLLRQAELEKALKAYSDKAIEEGFHLAPSSSPCHGTDFPWEFSHMGGMSRMFSQGDTSLVESAEFWVSVTKSSSSQGVGIQVYGNPTPYYRVTEIRNGEKKRKVCQEAARPY